MGRKVDKGEDEAQMQWERVGLREHRYTPSLVTCMDWVEM
jgi:hypothetical protein